MPNNPEPVKPTPFDVAPPPAAAKAPAPASPAKRPLPWLALSLAVLLAMVLVVFLWLPQQVNDMPAPQQVPVTPVATPAAQDKPAAVSAAGNTDNASTAGTVDSPAPWEEALQAKMRKQAQAILEPLLDLQLTLQEQGVETWAPREFAAALQTAQTGDDLYKQREFEQSASHYEQALAALKALDASRPERLQVLLEETRLALEQLDQNAAVSALQTLDALAPGNPDAATLALRADKQPQLLELFSTAATAETSGDLASALTALDAAKSLDPAHQRAAAEWQRINTALEDQQYQQAMSEGYSALAGNQLHEARKAFLRARALRPDAVDVGEALRQVEGADTASRLASLNKRGLKQEQGEQWQAAVETYRQALKLDSSVLFAAEGLSRATPRAKLDKQLTELIDNPGRLADIAVARDVAAQLKSAQQVSPSGPHLEGQIKRLQILLQQANAPVAVTLLSDGQTEVVLYKVARLGRFTQRPLELRPGTYTAAGSRNGYRDVRIVFTIAPGQAAAPVTIASTEPIR